MKILLVLYDGGKSAEEEPRLLGTTENKLGISKWLAGQGHELVTTSDKEGSGSEFRKHIVDADILITTPFHPGYLTREVMDTAKQLKLAVTAGVGSDHIDLDAANERKITVAEVTGSNVVSVAEHVVMTILSAVRNFIPAHEQVMNGGWDVAAIARNAFDLEGKVVGTLGCGRIGYRVLQRLKPFDCAELLYYDYAPLPKEASDAVGCKRVEDRDEFLKRCDVITVNTPLHAETKGMINKEFLSKLKKGCFLINTARGALAVAEDVAEALESGQINFYGGDVWYPQPAPGDHPWRSMRNHLKGGNGMTPHYSGTTLDAQRRYAEGTQEILKRFFNGEKQEPANLIVENGEYATKAYGQRNTKTEEAKEQVRTDGNA